MVSSSAVATTLLALSLGVSGLVGAPCAADELSPIRGYYYFVHWASMGRTELALAQFTEDAVVVAGPACTASEPCIGKAAILKNYFAALNSGRVSLPLRDQGFDGMHLRTSGETILAARPGEDIVRLRGGHVFEFRDGLIASLRVELDASDPPTARYIARQTIMATSRR